MVLPFHVLCYLASPPQRPLGLWAQSSKDLVASGIKLWSGAFKWPATVKKDQGLGQSVGSLCQEVMSGDWGGWSWALPLSPPLFTLFLVAVPGEKQRLHF